MTDQATGTAAPGPRGREVVMSFSRINLLAIPVAIAVISSL